VYPLDFIRLQLRVQDALPEVRRGGKPRHQGIIDCAIQIYQEGGISAFYEGYVASCLRYFPVQLFNKLFPTKDFFKKLFPKYNPKTQFAGFFFANLCSGGLAAYWSMAVVYPLDQAININIVEGRAGKKRTGYINYLKKVITSGHVTTLYTGLSISVAGILVYRSFQLCMFDTIVSLNPLKGQSGTLGDMSKVVVSQAAILCGAFISYPFDTIRRRLQWQEVVAGEDEKNYEGTIDCIKKITAEEGLAGFYKGFVVNSSISFLSTLVLMGYGKTRKYFHL
jgi:solute carrier family 25 (adenine nucleotide translocator) protein 4/5/6/31